MIKTIIQNDTCYPVFTAALFTTARMRKQPKCPSTVEWVKKMWYICTTGIILTHKKELINANCSNMDEPIDCPTD